MPTLTLAVPQEMKREMDQCPEINWSEVARESIRQKLVQLNLLRSIVAKSTLSEKEAEKFALEMGRKVNKSLRERFKKMHPSAF